MSDDDPADHTIYLASRGPNPRLVAVLDASGDCAFALIEFRLIVQPLCQTNQASVESAFLRPYYIAWIKAHPRDMDAVRRKRAQEAAEKQAAALRAQRKDPVDINDVAAALNAASAQ